MTGTMDRAAWGTGPWSDEPDELDWHHCGLACHAWRNQYGAWCGYVAIPVEHPLHGAHYNDVDLDAHGGLTYANARAGDDRWWFGFDCAHAYDYVPGLGALLGGELEAAAFLDAKDPDGDLAYRSLGYVRAECERLAEQLAAAAEVAA